MSVAKATIEKSGSIRFSVAASSLLGLCRNQPVNMPNANTIEFGVNGGVKIFKKNKSYCASTKRKFDQFGIFYSDGNTKVELHDFMRIGPSVIRCSVRYITLADQQKESKKIHAEIEKIIDEMNGKNTAEQLTFSYFKEIKDMIDSEGSVRFSPQIAKKLKLEGKALLMFFSPDVFPVRFTVVNPSEHGSYRVFKKGTINCVSISSVIRYAAPGMANERIPISITKLGNKFKGKTMYEISVVEK
jgi:hypothetical protein